MKPWDHGNLHVMNNNRYFAHGEVPFFLLADTAWTLFQKMTFEDSKIYIKNRSIKKFTAIAAVLVNFQSTQKSSQFSDIPNHDLTEMLKPEYEHYWQHINNVVHYAEKCGMYMMLLPVWGSVMKSGKLNKNNCDVYTRFLINRFARFKNIIWVLGGDIRGDMGYDVWNHMGTLFKSDDPLRLISFHPFGRTCSSYWFQKQDWIDFHMFQSGHRRTDQRLLNEWDEANSNEPWYGEASYLYVENNINRHPKRPILDGEPSYEMIPQGLHNPAEPYWESKHARRYAYWSVLSGSAGHVYGHNAIIQFYGTGSDPVYGVKETWNVGIHDLGSAHMTILIDLLYEVDFTQCQTMKQILHSPSTNNPDDVNIAFGNDTYILIYIFNGTAFDITLQGCFNAYWIDPMSGIKSYFSKINANENIVHLIPPDKKTDSSDWLLLLKKCA